MNTPSIAVDEVRAPHERSKPSLLKRIGLGAGFIVGMLILGCFVEAPQRPLTLQQQCEGAKSVLSRMFNDSYRLKVMDIYDVATNGTTSDCRAKVVTDHGEIAFNYSFVIHNGNQYVEGRMDLMQ